MRMSRYFFCMDELQDAMIQVKKAGIKESHAVIRLSR